MKSRRLLKLFLLSSILLVPLLSSVHAGPKYPDFRPLEARIQQWIDAGNYPGAGIWIVTKDGRTLFERYWNGFNREKTVMMASSTKWLEAATMMTLVDDGKLDLDEPISTYLPELKGELGENTLRQIFSHTSSLNSVEIDTSRGVSSIPSQLAEGKAKVKRGTEYSYGGVAMACGWLTVERVSGRPWLHYFGEEIAKPLRMKNVVTGPDLWTYQQIIGSEIFPTGNAADYMNFLLMLLNDGMFEGERVLSPESVREMEADHLGDAKLVNAPEYPERGLGSKHHGVYALGTWRMVENDQGQAVVLSSPSYAGYLPWIDRRHGVAGVFVGHSTFANDFHAFDASAGLIQLVDEALDAVK